MGVLVMTQSLFVNVGVYVTIKKVNSVKIIRM